MSTPPPTLPSTLALAIAHHRAGRLAQAAQLYQEILACEPRHADALRLLGVLAYQFGKHEMAVDLLLRAIGANPRIAEYHNDLGLALHALGRLDQAVAALQAALQLRPEMAEAHYNLANTLRALGQSDNAIASYQMALQIQPHYPEALNNLGNALKDRQQFDQAVALYRAALKLRPDFVDALNNLGNALQTIGVNRRLYPSSEHHDDELQQAVEAYKAALQLKADDPQTLNNLGSALAALGQMEAAITHYRLALRARPGYPEAFFNLGNAMAEQELPEEALAAYRAALQVRPDYPEALVNLGNVLRELRQPEAAMVAYRAATALRPAMAEAHNNLGSTLKDLRQTEEAAAAFRAAIEHRPDYAEAWSNLGGALTAQGRMTEAFWAYRRAVELAPANVALHSNLIYTLHFDPTYEPRAVAAELAVWNQRHAAPLTKLIQPLENDRGDDGTEDRPLRVGLVSPDFRDHPVGRFLLPLLRAHDPSDCQMICFSGLKPAAGAHDPVTRELRPLADRWHDTARLTDSELAALIRMDRVDVLVDLTMHMEGSRLLVFAQKPAPVQVTYLAYPTSTGLEAMDYRLTDEAIDPGNARLGPTGAVGGATSGVRPAELPCYTEEPLFLRSYWCYPAPQGAPEVAPLPARGAGHVTLACLNTFAKISPQALQTWMHILQALPDSRLFLHATAGSHREGVRATLAAAGIDPARCEFFGFLPFPDYLALHRRIDIALDPFPYAGGTTTCDALYMGVPVVTLAGPSALSRGGVSIMTAIGLPELIAGTTQEYVRLAVALGRDLPGLESLRSRMRERMAASPLMDGPGFARDFQATMRRAWRTRMRA